MHFEKRLSIFADLGFRDAGLDSLKRYVDLLWAANEDLNLISRKMTYEELIDNHVIDCLLTLKHYPTHLKNAADFGAGGGLPGVIFAIQFPETRFQLFEKSPKKREFLERCREIAPNLEIKGEIPPKLAGVEMISARAFKPVDVILDMSRSYCAAGGKYFLLKGRAEKISEEMDLARRKFKAIQFRVEALHSPVMDVERHLVLIG